MKPMSCMVRRMATFVLVFLWVPLLISPAAYSREGRFPGSHNNGGWYPSYRIDGGADVAAFFAGALIAGITFAIIDGVTYPEEPAVYAAPVAPSRLATAYRDPSDSSGSIVVTAQLLNVRSGPSLNDPAVQQIPMGTVLSIRGSAPGWYFVRFAGDRFGWVMSQFTAPLVNPSAG